ncbi:MAG: hypothetical protein GQ564_08645 [Bacteroidales bacterium]|nr:hypothetical protein [Bacteroidales bacterium]
MAKRLINFILIISLLVGCSQADNKSNIERVNRFENHIGNENAKLLTEIIDSFDSLLHTEFNCKSDIDCYILFLQSVYNQKDINFITNLPESKRIELKNKIVNTGLRKDIWQYEFELRQDTSFYIEEIFPVDWTDSMKTEVLANSDSVVTYNIFGSFLTGLELVQDNDSSLINYIDAIKATGGMSNSLLAQGLLYAHDNYGINDYFLKRIVTTEFFLLYLNI